jgi:SpoVK/Ycf46/Vps4 family AAA+-type ATPase
MVYLAVMRARMSSLLEQLTDQTCWILRYFGRDGEYSMQQKITSLVHIFLSRFDRMLYLGVSQTHEAQLNILQALTRKFKLHPELNLQRVAQVCPFHYTGADFYALCSDALLKAMSRKAEELDEKISTHLTPSRVAKLTFFGCCRCPECRTY